MHRLVASTAIAALILLALCPPAARAEVPHSVVLGRADAVPSAGLFGSGLFDRSRFELRHSLSYSMTSSPLGTASAGLWVTSLGYRATDNLRIGADVGAVLDPSGNGPVLGRDSFFLKSLDMSYRGGDNFLLHISYVNTPATAARAFGPYGAIGSMPGGSPWKPASGLDR
jgi:hypothetical protein